MKVVVDTNVYVEARFDKKKKRASRRLIDECSRGIIPLVYTADIAEEVLRVLRGSKTSDAFLAKAHHTFSHGKELSDVAQLYLCSDSDDNKFIDCAVAGAASYLITRDAALRALDTTNGIKVRTASEFYQEKSIWYSTSSLT